MALSTGDPSSPLGALSSDALSASDIWSAARDSALLLRRASRICSVAHSTAAPVPKTMAKLPELVPARLPLPGRHLDYGRRLRGNRNRFTSKRRPGLYPSTNRFWSRESSRHNAEKYKPSGPETLPYQAGLARRRALPGYSCSLRWAHQRSTDEYLCVSAHGILVPSGQK